MFRATVLALLLSTVAASSAVTNQKAHVTPIAKVIELMNDMVAKGVAAKNDEETKFAAFNMWCGNTERTKTAEIDKGARTITELKATIEKAAAHIRSLTDRIQELDEDVARWKKDQTSASDVRAKENADFKATVADYTESLDALEGAIKVLKAQAHDRAQAGAALLQVTKAKLVPLASKKALTAFLQQPSDDTTPDDMLFREAPEAHGYEFQSGGVVDMLEKLKDQFESQKYELEKSEMVAQHAFEDIMQQLTDNIENAEHEISKKTATRAETEQAKAEAEGDKAQTEADKAEDEAYLAETQALCKQKTADFESRQQLRADEIEAIQKAIEIMSSDAVAGSGEKHLPQLVQVGVSLAQLRRSNSEQSPLQARIASFLADRARSLNSRALALASQRVAADPFTKVKKMIKDMISKLSQEATEETEHKGFCDTELTTNKQTRDAKTEAIAALTAEKEELTSNIADLSQDLTDLAQAIKELDAAMAEATQTRTEAKAKNEETIADAKAAQEAVTNAMAVLKDFYAKSATATALVQQPAADAPETFDKPYTGMLPEGGSVVDFLEVILTDFNRLETTTATDEAAEADEYKKYMFESEKDKALKENESGHKSATKSDKEQALAQNGEELKLTQEQLDKAVEYYEKLKPTCVDSGITYEERVKRREEEIQSLQEALKILTGTDLS
jgi:prefoldin subunit 5